jgi:hypothetical protein
MTSISSAGSSSGTKEAAPFQFSRRLEISPKITCDQYVFKHVIRNALKGFCFRDVTLPITPANIVRAPHVLPNCWSKLRKYARMPHGRVCGR